MNEETRLGYRERARLVGRAVLAISIAPAVFFMWLVIGLPSIPGLHFGAPSAHADDAIVVQIAHRPGAAFAAGLLGANAPVHTATRRHHPASAVVSQFASVQPTVSAPPAAQPRADAPPPPSLPDASPKAPAGGTPAPAPAPAAPVVSVPMQTPTTPTVPLPVDLPPLPVQVPAVSVPQVGPPLPPLPIPPVVSNLLPPGLP